MTRKATVKATCGECGDISTDISNVILHLLEGSNDEVGQYRFICPKCKMIVLKIANATTINLLASAGAKKEYYNPSLELLDRPDNEAEIISLNDIIDLHFNLEQNEEAWIIKMTEGINE